jgi:hypothetical protein
LHKAINEKSSEKFTSTDRQMLDSCYSCHVASGKEFLRLHIPEQPEIPIVKFGQSHVEEALHCVDCHVPSRLSYWAQEESNGAGSVEGVIRFKRRYSEGCKCGRAT